MNLNKGVTFSWNVNVDRGALRNTNSVCLGLEHCNVMVKGVMEPSRVKYHVNNREGGYNIFFQT